MGDQQNTQLAQTYEIACERFADMECQRDELTQAIDELKDQLKWGDRIIASMSETKRAAE